MSDPKTLDARGLKCPMPIIKARKELEAVEPGGTLRVVATDPGSVLDFQGWAKSSSALELVSQSEETDEQDRRVYVHLLRKKP